MKRNERGLSLMEVLVASVILGVALLGFTSSFQFIGQTQTSREHHLEALNYARETLEALLIRSYDDEALSVKEHTSTNTTDPDLSLSVDIGLKEASRFYEVEPYDEDGISGKTITVTVSWMEEEKEWQETLTGFLVSPS